MNLYNLLCCTYVLFYYGSSMARAGIFTMSYFFVLITISKLFENPETK